MTGFLFGRWPSLALLAVDIGTDSSMGVELPNRSVARRSRASSTRCCNARRRSRSSGVGGRISSFSSSGPAMAVRLSDLQGIEYLNVVSADRCKLVNSHTVTACRQVCRPISQHDRRRAQQQASRPPGFAGPTGSGRHTGRRSCCHDSTMTACHAISATWPPTIRPAGEPAESAVAHRDSMQVFLSHRSV